MKKPPNMLDENFKRHKFPYLGEDARKLFVEEGKRPEDIGDALGVSPNTVRIWIRKHRWHEKRRKWLQMPAHRGEKVPETPPSFRKWELYGEEAERLFVREHRTSQQIAKILPVGVSTVIRWKEKYGWENKLKLAVPRHGSVMDALQDLIVLMAERLKAGEVDKYVADWTKGIKELTGSLIEIEAVLDPRAKALDALGDFTQFAWTKDPDIMPQLSFLVEEYLESLK